MAAFPARFATAFDRFWTRFATAFDRFWTRFATAFDLFWTWFATAFDRFWTWFATAFDLFWTCFRPAFGQLSTCLAADLTRLWDLLRPAFGPAFGNFRVFPRLLRPRAARTAACFAKAFPGSATAFAPLIHRLWTGFGPAFALIWTGFRPACGTLSPDFQGAWERSGEDSETRRGPRRGRSRGPTCYPRSSTKANGATSMTQHEFNEEVINNLARQNHLIASAYNRITIMIIATTINTIAIAGMITWAVTR